MLATILANTAVPLNIRQLAGLILRQHCEVHYDPEEERFEEPEISSAEKAKIRELLPPLLADSNSKLRTAASMVRTIVARLGSGGVPTCPVSRRSFA